MYYTNVLDLIGNTPLISLEQTTGLNIFAKAEFRMIRHTSENIIAEKYILYDIILYRKFPEQLVNFFA